MPGKSNADFSEAWRISLMDDVAYIPLHQQPLAWGVSKSLHVIQPPSNFYTFRWARLDLSSGMPAMVHRWAASLSRRYWRDSRRPKALRHVSIDVQRG